MPKSSVADDFTLFEWNSNLADLWDQFLTVLETQARKDLAMWEKGPWHVFGVTDETVQAALEQYAGHGPAAPLSCVSSGRLGRPGQK